MTETDADRLAKRIINTWHGGPTLPEWIDALAELDAGTAGTAFVRLRAKREHAPTIAAFYGEYRSLDTARPEPTQDTCPLERCPGDGWLTVHYETDGRPYRGAVPCTCSAGRANDRVYASVRGET